MRCLNIEEGKRKKRKQRSSLLIGVRTYNFHRDELKKRMNRNIGYRTWQNRCFEKLDDHPIYTIPNHHPTTMDFLPKTSVKIILAAKWLVRHSKLPTNNSDDLIPSLLSLSFFYVFNLSCGPGIKFTSCKSGKDRTGMAVSLEQVNTLSREFDLADSEYQRALDTFRR